MGMQKENNSKNPYEDIINLQHHRSTEHPHMSTYDRAAQFSPFAALTGFDGEIKETSRLTDQKIELDEAEKTILDEKLRIVQEKLIRQPEIEFTFFRPDEIKTGGEYVSVRGVVKKIDKYEMAVIMQDGTRISIKEIVDITSEIFNVIDNNIE